MASWGTGLALWARFEEASRVLSFPSPPRHVFFASPWLRALNCEPRTHIESEESRFYTFAWAEKTRTGSRSRLGWFILASRSAQRGPFTFISRQKIDTRPLRPVASKKLRKSARRRLRTASNGAAALGWRATQARETLPRLRAMPDGRRGPLTGCMHTKTAGRSFGRTALRVGPPAPGQRWLHTRREDFETRPDLPE